MTILDTDEDHRIVYEAIRRALGAALAMSEDRGQEPLPTRRQVVVANGYGCRMSISIEVDFADLADDGEPG